MSPLGVTTQEYPHALQKVLVNMLSRAPEYDSVLPRDVATLRAFLKFAMKSWALGGSGFPLAARPCGDIGSIWMRSRGSRGNGFVGLPAARRSRTKSCISWNCSKRRKSWGSPTGSDFWGNDPMYPSY